MYQNYTALGRTTDDLKLNFTSTDVPVANFSLAINNANNGKAEFIPCVVWGKKAKEYKDKIGKGSLLLIEGHLVNYSHTKKNKGVLNFLQVKVNNCKVVERREVSETKV